MSMRFAKTNHQRTMRRHTFELILGNLCAAIIIATGVFAGQAAPAQDRTILADVHRPTIVVGQLASPEDVFNPRRSMEATASIARDVLARANGDEVELITIRVRGATLSFDDLSPDAQERVQRVWQRDGVQAPGRNVRDAYERALASMLSEALETISASNPNLAVSIFGLPMEGRSTASQSNQRYAKVIDQLDAIVSSRTFIVSGDEHAAWLVAQNGLRQAMRHRDERPVLFRVNHYWQASPAPANSSGDAKTSQRQNSYAMNLETLRPVTSANDNGQTGAGDNNNGEVDNGQNFGDRPVRSSREANQNDPVPDYHYIWAGSGTLASDVDLSPMPISSESIVLLFERDLGLYPKIVDGQFIRGGLPQRASLTAHLAKIEQDLDDFIPDTEWDGYAVLDYEHWHPVWERTKPEYREASIQLVRDQNPNWPARRIERVAQNQYEAAAKEFLMRTMERCQQLRPNAKWGYWGYPRGYHGQYAQLEWIWEMSDVFYVDFYLTRYTVTDGADEPGEADPALYQNRVHWAMQVAESVAPDTPVVGFIWSRYTKNTPGGYGWQHVNEIDFEMMTTLPWQYDVDALAIWELCAEPQDVEAFDQQYRDRYAPVIQSQYQSASQSNVN